MSGNSPVDICQWLQVMSPSGTENVQWRGNEHLCGFALLLDYFTTMEHSLSVTTAIFFPFGLTLYICRKDFSTSAFAPLREHRLHVNSGQMWGDIGGEMLLEPLTQSVLLRSSAGNTELEHLSVLVLLELCFPLFFPNWVFDLVCRHRDCVVSMMSWATLITGKSIWLVPDEELS